MESGLSFSTIMQQAAKMKGAELDSMRTRFNSWPQHLQNSLFFDEGELRGRNVRDRLAEAAKRKEDASALLGKGEIMEALTLYERALGLFRWVASSDPGWRRNGIRDACLELHVDEGSGPEEAGRVRAMRLALLNNVALCHWHLQQFDKCIRACDEALEVDPACIKALYRRAKVRLGWWVWRQVGKRCQAIGSRPRPSQPSSGPPHACEQWGHGAGHGDLGPEACDADCQGRRARQRRPR